MIIKDVYSHNDGEKYINDNHKSEYEEIVSAVNSVDISKVLSKITYEKTKEPLLFSPIELNNQLKHYLSNLNWTEKNDSKKGFVEPRISFDGEKGFREMDGIKNKVAIFFKCFTKLIDSEELRSKSGEINYSYIKKNVQKNKMFIDSLIKKIENV